MNKDVRDEFAMSAVLLPLAHGQLRLPFRGRLWSHDADGSGGTAAGWAALSEEFLEELWRFADGKGASRLLGDEGLEPEPEK